MSPRLKPLSRRTLLRGAGGLVLGLPWLEAFAQGTPPKRFVAVFSPNGTLYDHWLPTGSGANFTLSQILQPLQPWQSKLLVLGHVDAQSAMNGPGFDHPKGISHWLTGTECVVDASNAPWGGGISVDQQMVAALQPATRFSSLELGVQVKGHSVWDRMSYRAAYDALPPEIDPAAALDRVFAGFDADPVHAAALRARRLSILDAVNADFARLNQRLGAHDRQRLDAHATQVRELERKIASLPPPDPSCAKPAGGVVDPLSNADYEAIGKLQMDILATALKCDLTRIASLQWSSAASRVVFSWLGALSDHHFLSHAADGEPIATVMLTQIHNWYAQQFAYLLGKLDAVPEGGGTLLDHCVVLWGNELGKANVHSHVDVPYLIAGGGGYFKMGQVVDCGHRAHNDLLVSCLNAMDVPATTFGNPAYCAGAMAGLT